MTGITISSGSGGSPITISSGSLSSYGDVLAKISGGAITYDVTGVLAADAGSLISNRAIATVEISDTAAHIASKFDALQTALSNRSVSAPSLSFVVSVTDSNPVALTASQLSTDSGLLTALAGTGITYSVSGMTVAAALALPTGGLATQIAQLTISDTAAHIASNLDSINSLSSGLLGSITVSDASPVAMSYTQFQADSNVIRALGSANFTVSGVDASHVASLYANSHVTSMTVTDTAANIVSSIGTLASDISKISSITVSNASSNPVEGITYSAYTSSANQAVLTKLPASVHFAVSGVSVANFATTVANSNVTSAQVVDTIAHLQASIDDLQTSVLKISSIAASDSATLNISAAQLVNDASVLAKLDPAINWNVTGFTNGTPVTLSLFNYQQLAPALATLEARYPDTHIYVTPNTSSLSDYLTASSAIGADSHASVLIPNAAKAGSAVTLSLADYTDATHGSYVSAVESANYAIKVLATGTSQSAYDAVASAITGDAHATAVIPTA